MSFTTERCQHLPKRKQRSLQHLLGPDVFEQLQTDDLDKHRRLYLEFSTTHKSHVVRLLFHAGFHVNEMKLWQGHDSRQVHFSQGVCCLVTGTVQAILDFLSETDLVVKASVDIPEFSRV